METKRCAQGAAAIARQQADDHAGVREAAIAGRVSALDRVSDRRGTTRRGARGDRGDDEIVERNVELPDRAGDRDDRKQGRRRFVQRGRVVREAGSRVRGCAGVIGHRGVARSVPLATLVVSRVAVVRVRHGFVVRQIGAALVSVPQGDQRAIVGVRVIVGVGGEVEVREELDPEEPQQAGHHGQRATTVHGPPPLHDGTVLRIDHSEVGSATG
jgi:hypothetical protein